MIEVVAGHLASGRWRVKRVDDIPVLSHVQAFSRRPEFRIGPAQLTAVETLSDAKHPRRIKLHFTDGCYCIADAPPEDLGLLMEMANRQENAPIARNQQQPWIIAMLVVFSSWIAIEVLRVLFRG